MYTLINERQGKLSDRMYVNVGIKIEKTIKFMLGFY